MDNALHKALTLAASVETELAKGTKHYRESDNKLLTTAEEVLHCMVDEGGVLIEPIEEEKQYYKDRYGGK